MGGELSMSPAGIKVAVLMGGIGGEREVSLQSGKYVAEALAEAGCAVVTSDITPSDMSILDEAKVDCFFIALHGKFGEDGKLQKVLEDRNLCYTGSDSRASSLGMDKMASKERLAKAGIAVAPAVQYQPGKDLRQAVTETLDGAQKLVIKPITGGSTVGVTIQSDVDKALSDAAKCHAEQGDAMIERFVSGRELTVGILHGKALPIIEIIPKGGFYDFNAKYVAEDTKYLFDTIDDAAIVKRVQADAVKCFTSLGCLDFSRMDFILTPDGTPWALEMNTIPGFTSHSLLPKAAAKVGIPMPQLCLDIVKSALKRHHG
jgi:D-alanine-D-alanine ligase